MKSHYDILCEQQRKWLDGALIEYNEKYSSSMFGARKYHQESLPDPVNYDPCDLVEIEENGTIWPHSHCGTTYEKNAVTPWKNSPHFIL